MGGAVSSGRDNDELVDNLRKDDYVKTCEVERVFRIVDRAHYYLPEYKEGAYKDLAWKCGTLHLSAPCIYSAVMEALELERGMSFLNLGSGTGYLNTMVGYMIGPYGINHGIELHEDNVNYARKKLDGYVATSRKFDDMDFCEPLFVVGNCLNLAPDNQHYDRVYCGASCPQEQKEAIQNMIKINGILVVPMGDQLLKIRRISDTEFSSENVLPVSFASLVLPGPANKNEEPISLPDVDPLPLQCICRLAVREAIRKNFDFQLPPPMKKTPKSSKIKSRIFRRERGRYPLDILPTAQGLMIVGAFNQSEDEEDDGDDEEEEEDDDVNFEYLDRQLQRHALELTRVRARLTRTNRDPSTDEIDSDLSDTEGQSLADLNGNRNVSVTLTAPNNHGNTFTAMEGEVDKKQDDEGLGDDDEFHEDKTSHPTGSNIMLENGPTIENKTDRKVEHLPISQLGGRSISLSSEEEMPTSASGAKSQAINMAVNTASGSRPLTIKSSYSTSADTSETSGFGSLIEDLPHIELPQSSLGSIDDNLSDGETSDNEIPEGLSAKPDTPSLALFRARHGLVLSQLLGNESTVNEENEPDEINDSSDAGWMDIDDEEDEEEDEDNDANERVKKAADACMEDEPEERIVPRGPDFSAFLKEKVDTLPIPNSMKAFMVYYR